MFSNISSQVTGWMGKKTGASGGANDEVGEKPPEDDASSGPPPPEAAPGDETASSPDGKKDSSPTKAGSRLDMLGNFGGSVKSQMSTWLGGGISGLTGGGRKTEGGDAASSPPASTPPALQQSNQGSPSQDKDDDDSSATGGADSDAALDSPGGGTPTDDKDPTQAIGAVSTKAIAGAKSIGNFLYSAVNKAGKTVSEASAKIKKTVEENNLLGEFNKEQEAFIKEKNSKGGGAPVPPWVGCPNQEALKEECLSLSTDRKNFVRAPPEGVEFTFDYETQFPICQAILTEDPNLEKMRFELVPKVISEENFWRNYLYRVSLICQANEVSSMVQEKSGDGSNDRTDSLDDHVQVSTKASEVIRDISSSKQRHLDDHRDEFVSDSLLSSSAADLAEVREGIKKLGIDSSKLTEEDWERELEAELQDYEMVGDGSGDKHDDGADHLSDIDDLK